MKKNVLFSLYFIVAFCVFGQEIDLDIAINESANYFIERLPQKMRIAITNFGAESYGSNSISEYIIDEIVELFVNNGRFSMIDRQNIDRARNELDFNMSGEVSDETAQLIGHFLGAQTVIFGSIKPMGNIVRFQLRAIGVKTAEILGIYTANIRKNDITRIFGKPPKLPRTHINVIPEFSLDPGLFEFFQPGLQAGLSINGLHILLDVNTEFSGTAEWSYHIGGLMETGILNLIIIGLGGGIGGGWTSVDSYPYIRGSLSMRFFDNFLKAGIHYDYNIDYGYKFGFRVHLNIRSIFWRL
jgi:TolB-like protein